MACKCNQLKSIGMKKSKKDEGMEILDHVMMVGGVGVGIVGAHLVKEQIPASFKAAWDGNAEYAINAGGAIIGIGAPFLMPEGTARNFVGAIGAGVAGQCAYAVVAKLMGKTGIAGLRGWDNQAYAMAKGKTRKLRLQKVAGWPRDTDSPGLMGVGSENNIDFLGAPMPLTKELFAGYGM